MKMRNIKKITGIVLSLAMVLGLSVTAFAAEPDNSTLSAPETSIAIDTDLGEYDLTKPFTVTKEYTDENGTPIVITSKFTPAPATRGSSTTTASVGSWESHATYGVIGMSYEFDLTKSGTHWKISNGRNFTYYGVLVTFTDPKLTITRSISSSSFPAEIDGTVTGTVSAGGITAGSSVCMLNTKVSDSGVVTTTWN